MTGSDRLAKGNRRYNNMPKTQQVYYDPQTKLLFTVKSGNLFGVVVSGGCRFYDDAITNIVRNKISFMYFQSLVPIDKTSTLLELDKTVDSFCVKGMTMYYKSEYGNEHFKSLPYAQGEF
jgi:hypothetical protein